MYDEIKAKVEAIMASTKRPELMYWEKDEEGCYCYEIDADYRDELSEKDAIQILRAKYPEAALYEQLPRWYNYADCSIRAGADRAVRESLQAECGADYEMNYYGEFRDSEIEDAVSEVMQGLFYCAYPADHFLRQDVYLNVFIDTGDGNYDFVLNSVYPHYDADPDDEIDDKASLVWLAGTQGYSKAALNMARRNYEDALNQKGFLPTVCQELINAASHMNLLVFLVRTDLRTAIAIQELRSEEDASITLDKSVITGLFDPWSGAGSVLEIELGKDITIPMKYIRSILPDGGDGNYSVGNVYGLCGSAWRDVIKQIYDPKAEEHRAAC